MCKTLKKMNLETFVKEHRTVKEHVFYLKNDPFFQNVWIQFINYYEMSDYNVQNQNLPASPWPDLRVIPALFGLKLDEWIVWPFQNPIFLSKFNLTMVSKDGG